MVELLDGLKRTKKCGEFSAKLQGEKVVAMGWVHRRRDLGNLIFLQLRDISGIIQVVFDTDVCDQALLDKASEIKLENVIAVTGNVRLRTEGNKNPNMSTGDIEIAATALKVLSQSETPPFSIGDDSANELLRLKYRYLDLRRESLQQNLIIRSKICKACRDYLSDNGFLEIETPMLGKSTPEGARDYLVPSRVHSGTYYALPQSPQLYKQLLMIGGLDRYYQIARCFRDEDLRANRQPEFTQVDIEMSFVDKEDDLIYIVEGLVKKIFMDVKGIELEDHFMRLTYEDAMNRFGSDKPDLRFGMEIQNVDCEAKDCGFVVFEQAIAKGGTVRAIVLKELESKLSRKDLDKLTDFVKTYGVKGLAYLGINAEGVRSSFAKTLTQQSLDKLVGSLNIQNGDIAFFVADEDIESVQVALGALRCNLASRFELIDKNIYKILWIVDFPLFEYSKEENRFVAKHHPFTAPKNEDIPLIKTNAGKVRAKAYDIVINGDEMGGGSMRIYNREIQKLMFETLGFTDEDMQYRFGYFIDAFNYGTPPHGGLAFGLDRLAMLLAGTDNIKEVIAFPKMQNARCNMSQAPTVVDQKQLDELFIVNTKVEEDA